MRAINTGEGGFFSFADYFADGPYRFQVQFRRASFREFYGPFSDNDAVLAERRRWLAEDEGKYLAVLPEGELLLRETARVAFENGTLPGSGIAESPRELGRFLGQNWAADYLLMSRGQNGIRLMAGCVCFPSSWALEEKIGRRIEEIHEIVPGLNLQLGRQIESFLAKLRPDACWLRSNWGLSRSPERNQHPARKLPRLDANVRAEEVFLRVEEQSLGALPESHGVLFGIRIRLFSLTELQAGGAGAKLRAALETMPDDVARYKGLDLARNRILGFLE